jgi:chemotaxis protein CheD
VSQSRAELPFVYLQPGEAYFSEGPAQVTTILGSCIAVTLFWARLRAGGICHVLLPRCRKESCVDGCEERYRFADCSIRGMLVWFVRRGARTGDLEVKVFGGSDILIVGPEKEHLSVGRQNIEWTKKALIREGLVPRCSDVGGTTGRKIVFSTHTGEVFMKRIRRTELMKGGIHGRREP